MSGVRTGVFPKSGQSAGDWGWGASKTELTFLKRPTHGRNGPSSTSGLGKYTWDTWIISSQHVTIKKTC